MNSLVLTLFWHYTAQENLSSSLSPVDIQNVFLPFYKHSKSINEEHLLTNVTFEMSDLHRLPL